MGGLYENMNRSKRLCEICGARVENLNRKTTTCDPVCTRAKHNGFTNRAQQLKRDLAEDNHRAAVDDHNRGLFNFMKEQQLILPEAFL